MKLVYYRGHTPNFGDELNTYLWPHLLPSGFLDEDDSELFLGIGSIIWDFLPSTSRKFIIGSGYGGYSKLPNLHDGSWSPVFVRGPRTAQLLRLPPGLAICDSAVLLRKIYPIGRASRSGTGFMPHFESLARGHWQEACALAGVKFIDPTAPVQQTLSTIAGLERLVTEAMHGAIVADALRTPWIAAQPIHPLHHTKWLDWSEALSTQIRWKELFPTNAKELYFKITGGKKYYEGRANLLIHHPAARAPNKLLTQLAARRLSAIARAEPQLSPDRVIAEVTDRADAALLGFVQARATAS
ncbi:polysaccharide pyruvyl transferase family protein [Devosia sp. 1566]|uniref:polysaccharide pyruvyl transferase family protein n=1 Tax=unclassified Devosia TaxID=196773 RepID=UPI000FD7ABE4|nr:polysaccharide pyruvyl transferase family protein [Devosia sp. 1566]